MQRISNETLRTSTIYRGRWAFLIAAVGITERKRSDERIATLAQEAEHRTKNILATVQATVITPAPSVRPFAPPQAIPVQAALGLAAWCSARQ